MIIQLLLVALFQVSTAVIIDTRLGKIEGLQYKTASGSVSEIYLNIPYAQPPVGELRFERPIAAIPWVGIRDGTAFGFDCIPHTHLGIMNEPSENCLTLNIIRPKEKAPAEGFPVLVWVHGGGFEFGSASTYGYEGFAEAYAAKGIIAVTIQYRLGWLGFFSSGDKRLPGNLGFWDQATAFKFIHQHIREFGGNPSKVTAMGLSAGGAAVSALALSPHSRAYISSTIQLSGSPWVGWSLGAKVPKNSIDLAEEIGCPNDNNLRWCLKTRPIETFFKAVEKIGMTTNDYNFVKWGPRIDGDFLPKHPRELLKEAPKNPAIIGVSDKDAAFFTIMGISSIIHNFTIPRDQFDTFDLDAFTKRVETVVNYSYGSRNSAAIRKIVEFYTKDEKKYYDYYLDKFTDFISDISFIAAAGEEINDRKAAGFSVFAYSFDHYNEAIWKDFNVSEGIKGSVHINEFPYLFNSFKLGKWDWKEEELVVRDALRNAVVQFTKTGNPGTNSLSWDAAGDSNKYLSITKTPEMKEWYYEDRIAFWEYMRAEFGFDIISATTYDKHRKDEL